MSQVAGGPNLCDLRRAICSGRIVLSCSAGVLDPWARAKLHLELALLSIAFDNCEGDRVAWLGVQLKEGDHLSGRSHRRVVDLGQDRLPAQPALEGWAILAGISAGGNQYACARQVVLFRLKCSHI